MCENSARTTPKLRELCENCARTTPITAAAKSLAHAVQNAPNRFKTLQNAKNTKNNNLSRNLTIMQQIANISARTGTCTAYKRCLHQRQPRTKFGHRPSPVGQSNNTTPPRHAQPNCRMAWQAPPRLHHELDEELDSEDEEEVLLEEL